MSIPLVMMKCLVVFVLLLATGSFVPLLVMQFTRWGRAHQVACVRVGLQLVRIGLWVVLGGLTLTLIVTYIIKYS